INCTIAGNQTGGATPSQRGIGGGINNERTMTIIGSTISGNTANTGTFPTAGIVNSSKLTLVNSTVSGNHGDGIESIGPFTVLKLVNDTITGNDNAGLSSSNSRSRNTIIAGNAGADLGYAALYNSDGHNLIGNPGSGTGFNN